MNCEDFSKYLDNYESLTEREKSDMDEHAAKCEACKAELDFFLSIINTATSLPKIEPPSDFMDKLNARLDAEDKRVVSASGIMSHLKRYGMRYAAAAACLALVAVITANRATFTDKMNDIPDEIIAEETVISDDSAQDSGQEVAIESDDTAEAQVDTALTTGGTGETVTPRQNDGVSVKKTNTASAPRATSNTSEQVSEPVSAPAPAKNETSSNISSNEQHADAAGTEPAPMNITAEESSPIGTAPVMSVSDAYSRIASDDNSGTSYASLDGAQNAPQTRDVVPEDVTESPTASQVQSNYSLADNGSTSQGRNYTLTKGGVPIERATAIGSIKFNSDDEKRAMEIINRYYVDMRDNIYTTDSVNLTLILSKLRSEGIPYTDYTVAGNGEVKFQVQFK